MRDSSHAASHRRLLAAVSLALLSALMPACGSETAVTPVVASVAGTWDLTSVNTQKLPFTLQASDPKQELISKRYVISATGTFTYAFTIRTTELDGTVATTNGTDSGTQTLSANLVTLHNNSDGSTTTASLDGNTMTIVTGSLTQLFTKL